GLMTVWVEQKFCVDSGETFDFSWFDRLLAASRLFWFYLGNVFWPVNLSLIYPRWIIDSSQWWHYLFPIGAIALLVGLWWQRDKARGPFAVCLCFLAILFPVLGFFNLSFYMNSPPPLRHSAVFRADHFQYLADIPIIALLCAGLAILWSRTGGLPRHALAGVCAVAVALLAFATSS